MPRKKKEKVEEVDMKVSSEFVYCGLRKCPHTTCLRHNINTPWNKLIKRTNFNPDKEWNCKDMVIKQ